MEIFTYFLIIYFLYLLFILVLYYFYGEYVSIEEIPNLKRDNKEVNLNSVVGLKSVKEEMKYYFDFISDNEKYKNWKVKLPRGILLVGPPGTGKTLLVKSLAKEIGIPVIHSSGSEFVEMYVGVGASRVRKLFSQAKSHKKCIIFIDEIDAVGKKRGRDSNSERDQTLNQLLVEMDGFNDDGTIMIFAATNLVNELDPALLRSGRFDKKIYFDAPNKSEREELFKLYLDNSLINEIDYSNLAQLTSGLSGADIANIVNQSKITAIRNNHKKIIDSDIKFSIDEVMIGREKPERKMTKLELERVARHEAGHALMSYLLKDCEPPIKVSILPRGEAALGFSQQKPDDKKLYTQQYILSQICVLLGGRSAEKIFYDDLSSGAHDDIEKVTSLINNYYRSWGMSNVYGPINFNKIEIKKDTHIINSIINSVKKLENFTISILDQNKDQIEKLSLELLNKETIDYNDIRNVLESSIENTINLIQI
tara:strand:+ start:794 stop:2233 length:1440 start_codon:yes stop_codon:yes gene_type:complete